MHHYLGVDIGGKDNTWMAVITEEEGKKPAVQIRLATLQEVVAQCQSENVMALAIDAQLTFSISRENGFRAGDEELRGMLSPEFRTRVASYNSLMAVPLRGTALAATVSPCVGTVIETHPTVCLLLEFGADIWPDVRAYKLRKADKKKPIPIAAAKASCQNIWNRWAERFGIEADPELVQQDGVVDATITATIAWLYHRQPERLQKLGHGPNDEVGRGPFWVVRPRLAV
jgi:predicted nuclease with RNAse H fold